MSFPTEQNCLQAIKGVIRRWSDELARDWRVAVGGVLLIASVASMGRGVVEGRPDGLPTADATAVFWRSLQAGSPWLWFGLIALPLGVVLTAAGLRADYIRSAPHGPLWSWEAAPITLGALAVVIGMFWFLSRIAS